MGRIRDRSIVGGAVTEDRHGSFKSLHHVHLALSFFPPHACEWGYKLSVTASQSCLSDCYHVPYCGSLGLTL